MALTTVATTTELKPGQGKKVEINGQAIALFNVNGTYYAIEDACSHVGGPLSEGSLSGTTVMCPWHGAEFDVTCGKVLGGPAASDLKHYPVQVQGQEIKLDL